MAWEALTFTVGQIFTAAQANKLQENIRDVRRSAYGATAPTSAEAGVEWWDTSGTYQTKKVYTGSQWIPTLFFDTSQQEGGLAPNGDTWGSIPMVITNGERTDFFGPAFTPKNMLLNGNFRFWQRGSSIAVASYRAFAADRWIVDNRGSFTVAVSQSTFNPGQSASRYSLEARITNPQVTLNSGNILSLVQPVEGSVHARTLWGSAGYARLARVSMWFWSGVTGRFSIYIANGSRNVTQCAGFNISVASTWTQVQAGFVAVNSGSWAGDNACGAWVGIVLAAHTSFRTDTPAAWVLNSPDVRAASGQLQGASTSGTIFRMTDVQFELGEVLSPFDDLPMAFELQLLRRYYQKTFDLSVRPADATGLNEGAIAVHADNTGHMVVSWPCLMRSNPNVSMYNPRSGGAVGRWYNFNNNIDGKSGSILSAGDSGIIFTGVAGVLSTAAFDKMLIHAAADAEIL